jgi:hypothetical protein
MPDFQNNETHTVDQIRRTLLHSNRKAAGCALKYLRKNGATDQQHRGLRSLFGATDPVGAPLACSVVLASYAHDRTTAGLTKLCAANPNVQARYDVFRFDERSPECRQGFDFKAMKRVVDSDLKRRVDHFVAIPHIVAPAGEPYAEVRVISWTGPDAAVVATGSKVLRRRSRISPATTSSSEQLGTSEIDIAQAVAALWYQGAQGRWDPLIGLLDPVDIGSEERRRELASAVIRASMPLHRIGFGHNQGKKLMRLVMREIVARAESLDIAGTAPLQPEGVASFLAKLPADRDGSFCTLPTLKLL